MKSRIFMYLFFFALLVVIFQYANSKKYAKGREKELVALTHQVDSLTHLADSLENPDKFSKHSGDNQEGFSLQTNDKAREFFEDQNMNVDSVARIIEGKIIAKNRSKNGNPLVPYHGIDGPMKVNRIKILNNRWVLAEFTDGTYWGEAIISYFFDDKNKIEFDSLDGILYNK